MCALRSTCRAMGKIFSRDRHSTTAYRGRSSIHCDNPRYEHIDRGIWEIPSPTYPHSYSCNPVNDAVPVLAKSGAESSKFLSTLSAPGTTNSPDPENRPNGTNVAPEDANSSSDNESYAVETCHQDHCHPPQRSHAPIWTYQSGSQNTRLESTGTESTRLLKILLAVNIATNPGCATSSHSLFSLLMVHLLSKILEACTDNTSYVDKVI